MSNLTRFSRYAFVLLSWVLTACIVVQTLLAGMAIFTDAAHWGSHIMFVHLFEFVPVLMLIVAYPGKLPAKLKWQSAASFGLIFIQYATVHIPAAGAVHPVIALVLFWLSLRIARQTGGIIRGD